MDETSASTPKVTKIGEPRYQIELTESQAIHFYRFLIHLNGTQTEVVFGENIELWYALKDSLGRPDMGPELRVIIERSA